MTAAIGTANTGPYVNANAPIWMGWRAEDRSNGRPILGVQKHSGATCFHQGTNSDFFAPESDASGSLSDTMPMLLQVNYDVSKIRWHKAIHITSSIVTVR